MTGRTDPWPEHCRRRLIAAILEAADLFPHSGEDSGTRIHDSRKSLKEARAVAKLFAPRASQYRRRRRDSAVA
jgi:hypothetical protein